MSNVMSHQTVSMAELKSVVKEIKTRLINRQSLILIQEVNYNENRGYLFWLPLTLIMSAR